MIPVNGSVKFRYVGYEESDYGDRTVGAVYESQDIPALLSRNWEYSNDPSSSILSLGTEFTIIRVDRRHISKDLNLETLLGNPLLNQDGFILFWTPTGIKVVEPFQYTVQEFKSPVTAGSLATYRFVVKRRYANS